MTSLLASFLRGFAVLAIGTILAMSHIAFAAAAPKNIQVASSASEGQSVADVDTTASVAPGQVLAENCYIDTQAMKSVRGKTIAIRVVECD
jgi:hypothetical protein